MISYRICVNIIIQQMKFSGTVTCTFLLLKNMQHFLQSFATQEKSVDILMHTSNAFDSSATDQLTS